MTALRHTILVLAISVASVGTLAQTDAEHEQHHPPATTQKASKANVAKSKSMVKESMAAMDNKMKAMHEMHEKMMAAKTPQERSALMAEHMKVMQDAMATMQDMRGMGMMGGKEKGPMMDKMPADMMGMHQMMEKRMDMMQSMMQMMMDRMQEPATK